MAITNGYITLAELKAHLISSGITVTYSADEDANMEIAIEAVSRWLDNHFKTTFYKVTEARFLTADWSDLLYMPDLISATTIEIDSNGDGVYDTTMTTADYWLEPRNARLNVDEAQKKPYRQIRINSNGANYFPTRYHAIKLTGEWGYCGDDSEPPLVIKQICLLMAHRVYRRKDAIFGVAGTAALGVQTVVSKITQDADIVMLLDGVDMRGF